MVTKFKDYLVKENLTENTVRSYEWTVKYFTEHYSVVNKKNLLAYKGYLVENFKPQTVNLRLQAINKYLEFIKHANSTSKCKITKCFCKSTPLVLRNSISFLVSH